MEGVRLGKDELIRAYGISQRLAVRVGALLAKGFEVSGTLLEIAGPGSAGVDAHSDVAGLLVDGGDHGAGVGVESVDGIVVADGGDDAADQRLEIDIGAGGNFAGNDDEAGGSEGLAGNAAVGVLLEAGVKNGVRDLVGDFVGMAFGDGFRGKEKFFGCVQVFPPRDADCHARWGGRIRWDCWFYGTRPRSAGQRVPAEGEPRWLNSKMRGLERVSDGGRSRPASRESRPRGVESGQRILMSEKTPQNLSNHVRTDWWFMVLGLIVTINLIVAIVSLVHVRNFHHVWVLILSLALIILWLRVRGYPLKVQDRVIRLEERLRLQLLAPPEWQGQIQRLSEDQLIGLRFAGDDEVVALARQALEENLNRKQIKERIRNWRADTWRV